MIRSTVVVVTDDHRNSKEAAVAYNDYNILRRRHYKVLDVNCWACRCCRIDTDHDGGVAAVVDDDSPAYVAPHDWYHDSSSSAKVPNADTELVAVAEVPRSQAIRDDYDCYDTHYYHDDSYPIDVMLMIFFLNDVRFVISIQFSKNLYSILALKSGMYLWRWYCRWWYCVHLVERLCTRLKIVPLSTEHYDSYNHDLAGLYVVMFVGDLDFRLAVEAFRA